MYTTELFANIDALKKSGDALPKALFLSPIPPEVIKLHEKRLGMRLKQDETPLLAVSNKLVTIGGYGWSGFLITDKTLYYRVLNTSYNRLQIVSLMTRVLDANNIGCIPIEQVTSLQIGNDVLRCYGCAFPYTPDIYATYEGLEFIVNGVVLGLLKFGGNFESRDKLTNLLRKLFKVENKSYLWGNNS